VTGFGPDHEKRFRAEVFVNEKFEGRGEGRSKKEAEQAAATDALDRLDREVSHA
jgi:ribonuclease III